LPVPTSPGDEDERLAVLDAVAEVRDGFEVLGARVDEAGS
jgi:hypothetical protein